MPEMKLAPLFSGVALADGGTLFSVIPKTLWGKCYKCDENNLSKIALRCLLVDTGSRKILIEAGAGAHYDAKFLRNHGLQSGSFLEESLKEAGYFPDEITDVVFTHLHWDHFNGAVKNVGGKLEQTFPEAQYWCSKRQWEHSRISNFREKVAYYPELLEFIFNTGKFNLVENEGPFLPGISARFFDGHTPGQLIPFIGYGDKTVVYMADFIPTSANIPIVWLASFDLFPVTAMEEKEVFLNEAADKGYILFFEHDFYTECATVCRDEKGVKVKSKFSLPELGFL